MALAQLSKVRIEYFPHGEGPERILFIHGFSASARIILRMMYPQRTCTVSQHRRGLLLQQAACQKRQHLALPLREPAVPVTQIRMLDETQILSLAKRSDPCRRLMTIPGVGAFSA